MTRSGPRLAAAALVLSLAVAGSGAARAQDYFQGAGEPLRFEVDRPRERSDKILIASLFGGALVAGGVGVLFHIDSRNKSNEVSTSAGRHSGAVYTEELDDTRRAALRSRTLTIVSYSVGGGLLVGTLVAYLLTDPGRETITVSDEPAPVSATRRIRLEPIAGGALVGAGWSF